ncbi:hypothetical protein VAWG006_38460 [Aeromonas enteropelogenes]|nr:hypothetical protein VAWG006_38460 [Aeromonas enteropelogenes]BEE23758.1 hypothetical protein VAWG007_38530 [Aeromonas enteropelogenes]
MKGAADLARRLTDPENADRKKPVQLHRPKSIGKLELSGHYQLLPRRASRLKAPAPAAARARKPPATEMFFMNISICI